ncbi:hypothetical protein H5410_015815 [Solanum commersonii]|uniref:Uncharacterized protein n=1 Tax=Solanum commersonii TaxID=4109 RepID=A0A9J5ZVN4_SOLCO|nr:hypothetical protein H5410_015815 [Solanum commersonii]
MGQSIHCVLLCETQKDKVKSAIKRSSRSIAEKFRKATLSNNPSKRENAEDKSRKAMNQTKERIAKSSWVQLKRVNHRPSPTLSTRESEWANAEVVLKYGNSVFERIRVDLG